MSEIEWILPHRKQLGFYVWFCLFYRIAVPIPVKNSYRIRSCRCFVAVIVSLCDGWHLTGVLWFLQMALETGIIGGMVESRYKLYLRRRFWDPSNIPVWRRNLSCWNERWFPFKSQIAFTVAVSETRTIDEQHVNELNTKIADRMNAMSNRHSVKWQQLMVISVFWMVFLFCWIK